MLVFHCKVLVASDMLELMTFGLFHMTWLIISGWLPGDTLCRIGALI
jgi:hypothetical protein